MRSTNQKNRYLRAATGAVIVIVVLLFVCIVELFVLAMLNAKLQDKEGPSTDTKAALATSTAGPDDTSGCSAKIPDSRTRPKTTAGLYIRQIILSRDSTDLPSGLIHGAQRRPRTQTGWVRYNEENEHANWAAISARLTIRRKVADHTYPIPRTGEKMTYPRPPPGKTRIYGDYPRHKQRCSLSWRG